MLKENLEKQAVLQSPHRIEELVKIFIKATRVSPDPIEYMYLTKQPDGDWILGHGKWHVDITILL